MTGWFSFKNGGATAGDLFARNVVCNWLERAGRAYDCALADPFAGGVDWRQVAPRDYSDLLFVCGPFDKYNPQIQQLFRRFIRAARIGVNLSMTEPLERWNPFDLLIERDSSRAKKPDIALLSRESQVPVVGLVLRDPVTIHTDRNRHSAVHDAIRRLLASREMAIVEIDTRLDINRTGLRSPAEIESLIARMDVVITTRLHGLVLAIKNGIPAVAIDPIAGGSNICRQAEVLGWPTMFSPESLTDEALQQAFDYCFTQKAREQAARCYENALVALDKIAADFISAMASRMIRLSGERRVGDVEMWNGTT